MDNNTKFKIESPVFKNYKKIPKKYTCLGENINPPLIFKNIPKETKSLALIIEDPDAPIGIWDHWIIFNINPSETNIKENSKPNANFGKNSWGNLEYGGPCPPSGTHRYFFKAYALNSTINLKNGISKKELEENMKNKIIAKDELIGLFEK